MEQSDRELLELAAKAAGYAVEWDDHYKQFRISSRHSTGRTFWEPLADDGDALRLAVKLGMSGVISNTQEWTEIYPTLTSAIREVHEDDPYAATRRAIVRAAAEIGRTTT